MMIFFSQIVKKKLCLKSSETYAICLNTSEGEGRLHIPTSASGQGLLKNDMNNISIAIFFIKKQSLENGMKTN